MTDLETAARALIADWDNRMSGEREQLKEYDGHEYWSRGLQLCAPLFHQRGANP